MPALRVQDFSGQVPILGDRAVPDNFAVMSFNTKLYSKELRGVVPPADLANIAGATRKVLRIPKRTVGGDPANPTLIPPPSYLGDSLWVEFTDPDTDIVRGQLVNDSFERWYFCSPTTGPVFNTYARLLAGSGTYKLGVPGPTYNIPGGFTGYIPIIDFIVGGAPPTVTRAFVYTWVNIYGEESSPSLPVVGTGNADAIWTIDNIKDPNPGTIGAGWAPYDHKNIYRTITGASGQTTYYKCGEVPIGTVVFDDNGAVTTDAILANNQILESIGWEPPPATLKGFIGMPNGYMIGFDGRDVWFSESYRFHAWPVAYKQASEYNVVGLGVLGQTCVVATEGFPSTISGARPAIASFTKVTTGEPALARGSIVSTPNGVIYASQNGLILVGPGGIVNVTHKIIARDDWVKDYLPQFLRATRFQNGYLALRSPPAGAASGFYMDPSELKVALTEFTELSATVNVQQDQWSGEVFLLDGGKVKQFDPPVANQQWPTQWRSKEFQLPQMKNFGCYAIYWDEARFFDSAIGASLLAHDVRVRFLVWANRSLIYDQTVPRNGLGVRLPSGLKADIWQFEIRARAPVYALHVATTMRELTNV